MRSLVGAIIGFLTLIYPIAVYFGIQYLEPRKIGFILLGLLLLRLVLVKSDKKHSQLLMFVGIAFCVLAVWSNNLITLRFYPVLISLSLFVIFASSLFYPPPVVERLARLQHPDLPEQGVRYTRKVTQIWCVFFASNGLIATVTAVWSSFAWWSLYNGFISYILMGLLMGIEYLVRIRTQEYAR
jgi:uncharacterized membrane protein